MPVLNKIKFLHCADIHLDTPFTTVGNEGNRSDIRRQELKQAFKRIINTAREGRVDYLLVSGDLYEHDYARKSTIRSICDEFESIRDISVVIIPGNHDPFVQGSFYSSISWPGNVTVLTPDKPMLKPSGGGVCIYGAPPSINCTDSPDINLLMVHGTVDMNIGGNTYNPFTSDRLESFGMDYVALGHFHNRLDGIGRRGSIYNPGSPEPLGFDEEGAHGVYLVTLEKYGPGDVRLEAEFKALSQRTYRNVTIDAGRCHSDEHAAELATNEVTDTAGLYSIVFRGFSEAGFRMDISHVTAMLQERAFFAKVRDETIPDYDFDAIMKEPGLRGLFTRKLLAKLGEARDEEERRAVLDALYFGMEAIDQGCVCI